MIKKEVVIVGGGISGLVAAMSLAKSGKEVLLIEKNENCGGLMNSFYRDGFRFEGGARALVNAGLIKPLIKEFELDIEMLPNPITIGVGDKTILVENEESLPKYSEMLKELYPMSRDEVDRIIVAIHDIIEDMKVLYGANNPLFSKRRKNIIILIPSLISWIIKYIRTMYRISKMNTPFEEYLDKLSENQSLKDIIGQHFFRKTPVFFALSYFALFNDYIYPKGGVGAFIRKLTEAIEHHCGEIIYNTEIASIDANQRIISDRNGNEYQYSKMIWSGDLKTFYSCLDENTIDSKFLSKFKEKKNAVLGHRGAESVFSLFLSTNLSSEYFREKASGHIFYTPDSKGLGTIHTVKLQELIRRWDKVEKKELYSWLEEFCKYNTYEISIPVLRDQSAAPIGKSGVIISVLFDYELTWLIRSNGWYDEFKMKFEEYIVKVISNGIYPELSESILSSFSSTPISVQEKVGSSEGSIVGWSFEGDIPAITKMIELGKSVKTLLPDVYVAGKWVYSPAGGPTAIMTGRIAAKQCK